MSLDKYFKRKSLEDEESIKASSHVTPSSSKKSHIEINPGNYNVSFFKSIFKLILLDKN
jgi:hypothetical protein